MKRRISDLIEEANFPKPDSDGNYTVNQKNLERFTQVVIQECAEQLEANRLAVYDANKHHEYWSCGVKWAVAKLRHHFAVKMKYLDCDTI